MEINGVRISLIYIEPEGSICYTAKKRVMLSTSKVLGILLNV